MCWMTAAWKRRGLAGLFPAGLLACAMALATASTVAAAPPPAGHTQHGGPHSGAVKAHLVRNAHHGGPRHRAPAPPPAPAPAPPATTAAPAPTLLTVTFAGDANLATTVGRTAPGGGTGSRPTPGLPGSLGGILSVPQPHLGGSAGIEDVLAEAATWPLIAVADGAAALALVAVLARRRRSSRQPRR